MKSNFLRLSGRAAALGLSLGLVLASPAKAADPSPGRTYEGLPLHEDHEYELVSTYDNTTDEDQDSMAVMLLYLLDQEFEKPRFTDLSEF